MNPEMVRFFNVCQITCEECLCHGSQAEIVHTWLGVWGAQGKITFQIAGHHPRRF